MRPVTKGGGGSLILPFFITKIAGYAAFFVSILHDFSLDMFAISPLFGSFPIWLILCRKFNAQWFR